MDIMYHHSPQLIATAKGIFINGMQLAKADIHSLSPESWRYIKRASELLEGVKPEEWENRTPHQMNDIPTLAKVQMLLALAPENLISGTLHKAAFNFVTQIAKGKTLLVGEGNLSFTLSLVGTKQIIPSNLIATTFEPESDWPKSTQENAKTLQQAGIKVLSDIDATDLSKPFGTTLFDNIVFQFPHTGNRDEAEGHNSNFVLIRDFLISAASHLTHNGQVLISAVDSPHYKGAFQFEEAAKDTGFCHLKNIRFPHQPSRATNIP